MKAAPRPRNRRHPMAAVAVAPRWAIVTLWILLSVLLALIWALPARAGDLNVLAAAAYPDPKTTGCGGSGCGLRVTPGSTCAAANDLNITAASISGSYQACNTITAGVDTAGGVKTTGDTTFTAGHEIILKHKFTVDTGDSFTAIISSPLTQWAYVQDNSPAAEKTYNASFYLNVNSLNFNGNTSDRLHHFVGYSSDGQAWLRVVLRWNNTLSENRLIIEARNDNGSWDSTEGSQEIPLAQDWNTVELSWSAGAGNGSLSVTVTDSAQTEITEDLSALDNDQGQIDHIKWGAVGTHTSIDAISGTLDVDEFSSWR